jgi:hypothetical protein
MVRLFQIIIGRFFGRSGSFTSWIEFTETRAVCQGIIGKIVYKNPHPKGWGYTDKARLRGLK